MDLSALELELLAAARALEDEIEGLRDILRLDVQPDTAVAARAALLLLERRVQLLQVARDGVRGLINDRYPALPPANASAEVLDDIRSQLATIEAAAALFRPLEAARLETGPFEYPQPKREEP